MEFEIVDFKKDYSLDDNFEIERINKDSVKFYSSSYGSRSVNQRITFVPEDFIKEWFLSQDLTKKEFVNMINSIVDEI